MSLLLIAALLPPLFLMRQVYRQDTVEHEPIRLIARVFFLGALSVIPIVIVEILMEIPRNLFFTEGTAAFILFDNIIGVALIEELGKYFAARTIWKNPEFNYRFDGVVYCVAASLGFAALENIEYVVTTGLDTAFTRAIFSIPGHCIFGIFMGIYFGEAKYWECRGNLFRRKINLIKCILVPVFLHGVYDSLLSFDGDLPYFIFLIFVVLLDIIAIFRIKKSSKEDRAFYIPQPAFIPESTDFFQDSGTPGNM